MSSIFIEMIGWSGSALILTAYAMVSLQKISSNHIMYHAMNIVASFLLATYGAFKGASANVFLNVIWLLIGLYAIHLIRKMKKL